MLSVPVRERPAVTGAADDQHRDASVGERRGLGRRDVLQRRRVLVAAVEGGGLVAAGPELRLRPGRDRTRRAGSPRRRPRSGRRCRAREPRSCAGSGRSRRWTNASEPSTITLFEWRFPRPPWMYIPTSKVTYFGSRFRSSNAFTASAGHVRLHAQDRERAEEEADGDRLARAVVLAALLEAAKRGEDLVGRVVRRVEHVELEVDLVLRLLDLLADGREDLRAGDERLQIRGVVARWRRSPRGRSPSSRPSPRGRRCCASAGSRSRRAPLHRRS